MAEEEKTREACKKCGLDRERTSVTLYGAAFYVA